MVGGYSGDCDETLWKDYDIGTGNACEGAEGMTNVWRYNELSKGAFMVECDSGNGFKAFALTFNSWDADLIVRAMVEKQRDIP
jgi:hypothetical protein